MGFVILWAAISLVIFGGIMLIVGTKDPDYLLWGAVFSFVFGAAFIVIAAMLTIYSSPVQLEEESRVVLYSGTIDSKVDGHIFLLVGSFSSSAQVSYWEKSGDLMFRRSVPADQSGFYEDQDGNSGYLVVYKRVYFVESPLWSYFMDGALDNWEKSLPKWYEFHVPAGSIMSEFNFQ